VLNHLNRSEVTQHRERANAPLVSDSRFNDFSAGGGGRRPGGFAVGDAPGASGG